MFRIFLCYKQLVFSLLLRCSARLSQDLVMAAQLSLDRFKNFKQCTVLPHAKGLLSRLFPLLLLPLPMKRSSRLCGSPATKSAAIIIGIKMLIAR